MDQPGEEPGPGGQVKGIVLNLEEWKQLMQEEQELSQKIEKNLQIMQAVCCIMGGLLIIVNLYSYVTLSNYSYRWLFLCNIIVILLGVVFTFKLKPIKPWGK